MFLMSEIIINLYNRNRNFSIFFAKDDAFRMVDILAYKKLFTFLAAEEQREWVLYRNNEEEGKCVVDKVCKKIDKKSTLLIISW